MLNAEEAISLYNKSPRMKDSMAVATEIEKMLDTRIANASCAGDRETKIVNGYEHLDDLFFQPSKNSIHENADNDIVQAKVIEDLKAAGYQVGWSNYNTENSTLFIKW